MRPNGRNSHRPSRVRHSVVIAMRTKAALFFTAALLFGAVATALGADEFDAYFADIGILQLKPVQTELGVTEAQRASMNKHADWLNVQSKAIDSQVRSGKMKPEDANKLMQTHLVNMKNKIIGELTAAQLKRLREITLQRDGLLPLLDKKLCAKIGVTETQRKKLADAYLANDQKAKQLQTQAFKPIIDKYSKMTPKTDAEKKKLSEQADKELQAAKDKIQPQIDKLGKDYIALVDSTLTAGQKDAFNKLKGKPFIPKVN